MLCLIVLFIDNDDVICIKMVFVVGIMVYIVDGIKFMCVKVVLDVVYVCFEYESVLCVELDIVKM